MDDYMERELRDALDKIEGKIDTGHMRLEAKLDQSNAAFTAHVVESAKDRAEIRMIANSAQSRIDDHLEDHKEQKRSLISLWIGVILAALSGIGSLITSLFKGGDR